MTHDIAHRAWKLIEEIESLGGMAKAIATGLPKKRIEEAAARKQGLIDSGKNVIVGVNKYTVENQSPLSILEVDNTAVREAQVKRLVKLRKERNEQEVQKTLDALTQCAQTGQGNLLALSVEAARKRATLGEISYACEKVFQRYQATVQTVAGIYGKEMEDNNEFTKAQKMADEFSRLEGRRPRILVAKIGQDGHDRGSKVIATSFADIGFDVDVGPLFQTPKRSCFTSSRE